MKLVSLQSAWAVASIEISSIDFFSIFPITDLVGTFSLTLCLTLDSSCEDLDIFISGILTEFI